VERPAQETAIFSLTGPDATGPRMMAAVAALRGRAAAGGPVRELVTATVVGSGAEGRACLRRFHLACHFRVTLVTWGFSHCPGMSRYPCALGRAAAGIPAAEIKE